ncbi:MAG: glycosyl hydrolase [Planctomycetia bacterium]|nr:glycosyl hydrolase [Planctomycetia bacterium]
MSLKRIFAALATVATALSATFAGAADATPPARPTFVAPRTFSFSAAADPETIFWPCYFWWWNGPLEPEVLHRQIADMKAHDIRSVVLWALARDFRPGDYDMEPDYLTPEFFQRVKLVVDDAARLKMFCWLVDDAAWPAGFALRKRPELASHLMVRGAGGQWTPGRGWLRDFLDPATTAAFVATTHEPYYQALGPAFGPTVKFMFTDEPSFGSVAPGSIPWTVDLNEAFQRQFGYDVSKRLDAFRAADTRTLTPDEKKVRVDLFDFWSGRFHDAFFLPKQQWCWKHGVAQCGHLGGEDETVGAVKYGFGHVMRQLRAMDMPGVDAIWRQLFPGRQNHHFPKFASSAAHQNGTALAFSEAFAIYGSGLTPAEMKWVLDYQFVRGINIYLGSHYPISTRDHSMSGERPRLSPVEPLWDFLPELHRYAARLGYVLACGQPDIATGLYYPVRDIWANGDPADPAVRGHDALAQSLACRQCDFDVVDDDVLSDPATRVESGRMAIGPMRYRTIVVGPTQWMAEASKKRLDEFQASGGQVVRVDDLAEIDAAAAKVAPTVQLDPPSPHIRVLVRRWPGGGAAFLFNEGQEPYKGTASLAIEGKMREIEPATGLVRGVEMRPPPAGKPAEAPSGGETELPHHAIELDLAGWQSLLLVVGPTEAPAGVAPPSAHRIAQSVDLADGWTARVDRRYVVGEHDFEIHPADSAEFKPVAPGRWAETLGQTDDFSGHVTYRRKVTVPAPMRAGRLLLELRGVEYAARVKIDGRAIGCVLWSPWQIELPASGPAEFVLEIEVSTTLAND